ncbi:MAG: acyltransferase [Clostridia bacterium]
MTIRVFLKMYRMIKMRQNPVDYARSLGVHIGVNCRILAMTDGTFGSEPYLVNLGNHVSVTAGVSFVTHDGGVWLFRDKYPEIEIFAPISVGNNVFIGIKSIIMPGVTIGNDCIIAAGSIVTRSVPDGSVIGGIPAKLIKSVDDYRKKIDKTAFYIKGLSAEEKKLKLLRHFANKE